MIKKMLKMFQSKGNFGAGIRSAGANCVSHAESYWNANPLAASQNQWTSNETIGKAIYSRMTNGESSEHWLNWLLGSYLKGKHFSSVLSPGCGVGDHELAIARTGVADCIDTFDFSESSINLARQKAANEGLKINFYIDDLNTFEIPKQKKYNLIFSSGALHHVKELERYLSTVRSCMSDGGYFIVNEYIGDCYNIYNEKQLGMINCLLSCIPPELKSSNASKITNPTIEQVMSTDPSESVRSKLIIPFLQFYFDIELINPYGGCILHSLYPLLDSDRFSGKQTETNTIINLLLAFEGILMQEKVLESDFALIVCRKK